METISAYCSWADEQVLSDGYLCAKLPAGTIEVICASDDPHYFDTLARAILVSSVTEQLFILYEPVIVDLAARCCNQTSGDDMQGSIGLLACFARILPAKPCLKILLEEFIKKCKSGFLGHLADSSQLQLNILDSGLLSSFLLALFRLYSYDVGTYGGLVSPVQLSSLLRHEAPSIRYLSIRCLALYMKLADALVEKMISTHIVQKETIIQIDSYRATTAWSFTLWEEQRWRRIVEALAKAQHDRISYPATTTRSLGLEMLSSETAALAGVLLPRMAGPSVAPSMVPTPTTTKNFEKLAKALLDSRGVLLIGASGSGKTLLITEAAKLLNKLPFMITLHLNEQTDAKSLLGIYTTSPIDGSFIWQPGVLTRAMIEGRWVMIEDIHLAPPEVIHVVLPIIEHGEILLPSRNEKIRAATGFCALATTDEISLKKDCDNGRLHSTLAPRLWNIVEVEPLRPAELEAVLSTLFPLLELRIPSVLSTHREVQHLIGSTVSKISRIRYPDLGDLLKWCRRSQLRIKAAGLHSAAEAIDESVLEDIFKDAVTCYAGHIPSHELHVAVVTCIAEVLQVPALRVRHCIYHRLPSLKQGGGNVSVGRAFCPVIKRQVNCTVGSNNKSKTMFTLTRGALKTMEEIAAAVQYAEPALLVGETGIGKTAVIQHLAALVGQKLSVFNLSQQSESGDLLGGFKPITTRALAVPMAETFEVLFDDTFSQRKNVLFQASVRRCILRGSWTRLISHWQEAVDMANIALRPPESLPEDSNQNLPNKRRKLHDPKYEALRKRWQDFAVMLSRLTAQVSRGDRNFAMAFVEGKIVRALRNGEWVLLDEINLASPETLQSIVELLQTRHECVPSLLLSESGRIERVEGHRDFRIFAAMNPATDSGKRELPDGIRKRFTEIFVQPSDTDLEDLTLLVSTYLGTLLSSDQKAAFDLANCYLDVQRMNDENRLTDGAGQVPHFSIRSLVRTLIYTNQNVSVYGLRRALYEGFLMSFATILNVSSEELVVRVVERHLLGAVKNARSLLNQNPKIDGNQDYHILFRHHLVKRGSLAPEHQPHYIITPFVERNLLNLARAVSVRRFPILLQGPTSSGKTSMVEYLAKVSGNEFIRINNHEHTDLQEYLGSYASGEDGRLQYREGVLVEALRRGQWIVLDELNLAPTDVLEALNRLLDDNRELFIPETQEIVKPHPDFVLFATQNPAGLYGGRKHLSRAFRNRFLELHFDDIPENELEFILKERTQIAPSFCSRIVSVYKRLSTMRQSSRLFEQRNSFATLRDLFRWASRKADDREQLAVNGFMLLAERVRDPNERAVVKRIIEDVMKVQIDESKVYSSRWSSSLSAVAPGVVLTPATRRLLVLVMTALENNEPVLLVGETGCGKTQICQTAAEITGQHLHMLNAHSNTETGDLIGAQRPVRNKAESEQQLREDLQSFLGNRKNDTTRLASLEDLINHFESIALSGDENSLAQQIRSNIARTRSLFEWVDGSLVLAMKHGEPFLLDEISLAEDAVLERLNSVLEPRRSMLLAEKGPVDSLVVASPGFQFLATMNPGGDHGKRELSSALRNRLTEIWVPPLSEQMDILPILQSKLGPALPSVPHIMVEFAQWFRATFHSLGTMSISLREMLTWVDFVRANDLKDLDFLIVHGAALVFIDSLGANPAALTALPATDIQPAQQACIDKLGALLHRDVSSIYLEIPKLRTESNFVECGNFRIACGSQPQLGPGLVFDAATTRKNAFRILRALQLSRPVLLEGDPGVGKTALVEAIAQVARKRLTRINLSDQTDLMDLFGSDVPTEGGSVGDFSWRDGPFLRAMQNGDWVLLDEMNLATQSVLEGLNSCLDHRKQVYIVELDRTFTRHQDFVLFATQNPHHQGGGRKGLPASFVNRFTVVYADALTETDLMTICQSRYMEVRHDVLAQVVSTVSQCRKLIQCNRSFDSAGGPWEINLRDIGRWVNLYMRYDRKISPTHFCDLVLSQRFRTPLHRIAIRDICNKSLRETANSSMFSSLSASFYQLGDAFLERDKDYQPVRNRVSDFSPNFLPFVRSVIHCVNEKWPVVLVGGPGSGKSMLIRQLAALHGAELVEVSVSEDLDTIDLLGGFEQVHRDRTVSCLASHIRRKCLSRLPHGLLNVTQDLNTLLEVLHLCNMRNLDLGKLQNLLTRLACFFPEFVGDSHSLQQLITRQSDNQEARFSWTDGVLIEAVMKGYWLVLDNANTCNSAVLDRLNSLLESGGSLVVSEQHEKDGCPRVICPHPNFRIFLTMDPRRGGLSRAMRNRSVEIFLDVVSVNSPRCNPLTYPSEAAIFRWRRLRSVPLSQYNPPLQTAVAAICVDHLSLQDLWNVPPEEYDSVFGQGNHLTMHELAHYYSLPESLLKAIQGFYLEAAKHCPVLIGATNDQPMHTESNEPLIQMIGNHALERKAERFGWLLESFLTLCRIRKLLSEAETRATSVPIASMTILERSIAVKFIPGLSKEGIGPIRGLIDALVSATDEALTSSLIDSSGYDHWRMEEVNAMLTFLKDMVKWSKVIRIRPGLLSTYLQIARELFSKSSLAYPATADLLERSLAKFGVHLTLRYGQSLSQLWSYWRPRCARNSSQLNTLLKLEEVMQAFDSFREKAYCLPQMMDVQRKLLVTRDVVLQDTGNTVELVEELQEITSNMKLHTHIEDHCQTNYFATEFEGLCQYHDLDLHDSQELWSGDSKLSTPAWAALLAGRNTKDIVPQSTPEQGPARLARITSFGGWSNYNVKVAAWKDTFAQDLLLNLERCHQEPIKSLGSLTNELSWLTKSLSHSTRRFTESQLDLLQQQLIGLICGVVACHKDLLKHELRALASDLQRNLSTFATALVDLVGQDIFDSHVSDGHHFRHSWESYLGPALSFASCRTGCSSYRRIGAILVFFSLGSLQLWIPDRPTDPALGLSVQRERYQRQNDELETKIQAIKIFESTFSGLSTSLRIRKAEQEMAILGQEPPPLPVARFDDNNLLHIHEEFSNILNGIVVKRPERVLLACVKGPFEDNTIDASERAKEIGLLKHNIDQLVRRLSESPREYDDLALPVAQLLQILDLGAKMLDWSDKERLQTEPRRSIEYIAKHTLLLGATPASLLGPNPHYSSDDGICTSDVLHLETASLMAKVCFRNFSDSKIQSKILLSFESCYANWKAHLQVDQANEARKAKYYEYRYHDEDDSMASKEFNESFPAFDGWHCSIEEAKRVDSYASKAFTLQIANLHATIFAPVQGALQLKQHLLQRGKSMAVLLLAGDVHESYISPVTVLPALFLLLEEHMQFLRGDKSSKEFNIYADPNVNESLKLLSLVLRIVERVEAIRETWPEHALPIEILARCQDILRLQISDPIAKLLTGTEMLHASLNEWQAIASRQNSVTSFIDELAALIISWRRLELSSWSRLLSDETRRCEEDAKSWWFVAYEVAISIPLRLLSEGGDCARHAQDLASTLISFLQATSLGQFACRLNVLENFHKMTVSMVRNGKSLEVISSALSNVIRHFRRYEPTVKQSLIGGRGKLEQEIRELIKVASWKDTNVTTLRESARRSHHKLFKVIKRYRELLARPVETFSAPDADHGRTEPLRMPTSAVAADEKNLHNALRVVARCFDGWGEAPKRFREPQGAALSMLQLYHSSQSDLNIGSKIHEYGLNLRTAMTELKAQTPSKTVDENRALLMHLKARKQRLLADVLRDVRHMGIQRNLNAQDLERQMSLGSILGTVAAIHDTCSLLGESNIVKGVSTAAFHFHGFLDLIGHARKGQNERSEDLTSSEVGRCIGSLEGFLLLMRNQRNALDSSIRDLVLLQQVYKRILNLQSQGASDSLALTCSAKSEQEQVRCAVSWLPQILDLACDVLEVQRKHGDKELTEIVKGLKSYQTQFKAGEETMGNLLEHEMPSCIQSQEAFKTFQSMQGLMAALHKDLDAWIADERDAAYVLTQLVPWTDWNSFVANDVASEGRTSIQLDEYRARVSAAIDKIFVGMQNHHDISKKLPNTVEDVRWLLRCDQGLILSIRSFHISDIANEIGYIMSSMSSFDKLDFQKAISLCTFFSPIVQQFYLICEHAVEGYADLHAETCRLAYVLVKSFNQIASEGYCGPTDVPSDTEDTAGQPEQGTGLGEGEGVEDISRDVGDDEDLSELAQQRRDREIEELAKDENAVDMGEDDLHGEMDDGGEVNDVSDGDQVSRSENNGSDYEEETGSVDDLDPSAVDEKLWEGLANGQEKELQNQDGVGKPGKDEIAAGDQNDNPANGSEEVDEDEDETQVEQENPGLPQVENADPHLEQEQALEIPDAMHLDGDQEVTEDSISENGLDDFSDASGGQGQEPLVETDTEGEKTEHNDQGVEEQFQTDEISEDKISDNLDVEDDVTSDRALSGEDSESERDRNQTRNEETGRAAEGYSGAKTGASEQTAENETDDQAGSSGIAPEAEFSSTSQDQQATSGSDPQGSIREQTRDETGKDASPAERPEAEAFKKLGDILERWHRQRREILQSSEGNRTLNDDMELADADFEHVTNEQDQGDGQALGGATKDQAQALDEHNALEDPHSQKNDVAESNDNHEPEDDLSQTGLDQVQLETKEDAVDEQGQESGTFTAERRRGTADEEQPVNGIYAADELEDVGHQSLNVELSVNSLQPLISPEEALRLWAHFSSVTHPLSLILTEQLRLILSPTQATRLRGDFRTGKRLNIKRIIPYIASQYKRDKIWMRRSIPSKRGYQIMIAVDDSKSMMEGGAHALAFETLALLCKSLSMLEVGEVCVVSFGDEEHIRIAHSFGTPLTNESGTKIYQNFSFQQRATNVKRLIQESVHLFREARVRGATSNADLWQLQLIVSDGIYEEHELVRRLVLQASEERIMIVFVIVDSNSVRGNSIVDLNQAVFEPEAESGEMKMRMKRYLDGFPFPYYVVVREVGDLPGVLATALKGWFREVVDVR